MVHTASLAFEGALGAVPRWLVRVFVPPGVAGPLPSVPVGMTMVSFLGVPGAGPWVSTEVLATFIGLVIYYLAFSAKSHIQA